MRLDRVVECVTDGRTFSATIDLFRTALYLVVIVKTLVLLPAAPFVWGPNAYLAASIGESGNPLHYFQTFLLRAPWDAFYPWFMAGQILFAVLAIVGVQTRFSSFCVYFFTTNLNAKAWLVLNGGDNIAEIMLLLMVFMVPGKPSPGEPTAGDLFRNTVANVTVIAARLQLVLVYLCSGLTKATGPLWQHGVAVYYTLETDEYSTALAPVATSFDWLIVVATYFTVAFQIAFVFLVWSRSTRWIVMTCGVILHLQIALLMGLWDFSLSMLACYFVFASNQTAARVREAMWPSDPVIVNLPATRAGLRIGRVLRLLDWRKRIVVETAVEAKPADDVPLSSPASATIRVIDPTDSAHYRGYHGLVVMLSRLPAMMPMVPVLYLVGYLGLFPQTTGVPVTETDSARSVASIS